MTAARKRSIENRRESADGGETVSLYWHRRPPPPPTIFFFYKYGRRSRFHPRTHSFHVYVLLFDVSHC